MDIKRWLLVAFFGVLAAVTVPLLLSDSPNETSAQEILTDACDFQGDLQSMKMVVTGTQYEEDEGVSFTTVIRYEEDISHIMQTVENGESSETVLTASANYSRVDDTDTWVRTEVTAGAFSPVEGEEPGTFCGFPSLVGIETISEETLDGRPVVHIRANSDMDSKASSLGIPDSTDNPARQQFSIGKEYVEFWVDKELRLPIKIRQVASFPQIVDHPSYGFDVTMRYSDFNIPFGIAIPENVVDSPVEPSPKSGQ